MPEDGAKLLLACSRESGNLIEACLGPRYDYRHIDRLEELQQVLAREDATLVFSDVEMPQFTALDLVTLISDLGAELPVLILRGTGDERIAVRCLAFGTCHFIEPHPLHLEVLPQLVETLLARAEQEKTRRLMERRLREAEERYLDVFDNTSDLIQCLAPDGRFLYTNRAWREAMGYSEEEVRSLHLLDVLHPDSMICCQDRFQRLLQGESLACITFKFVTKSGETLHLYGDCGTLIKDGEAISTRGIFKNMTEVVRAEEALRLTEARYQTLYENAPDIYVTLNPAGQMLSINRSGARMLGYEVEELLGESIAKLVHPEEQAGVFACIDGHFRTRGAEQDIEYRMLRKNGSPLWVHQRATLEPAVQEPRLLVVCRDVTDRRILEAQLAHQATHDPLTNLINRREFERRLQRLLAEHGDPSERHALCYLDLDQFKIINDTCGHMAGDELLRQIATLLEGQIRARDTLARLGGDEFAILMEHTPLDKAAVLAEKLRTALEGFEFHWRAQRFSIGVSIGLVGLQRGQSVVDTLNRADMACYQAKRTGRNRLYAEHAGMLQDR